MAAEGPSGGESDARMSWAGGDAATTRGDGNTALNSCACWQGGGLAGVVQSAEQSADPGVCRPTAPVRKRV